MVNGYGGMVRESGQRYGLIRGKDGTFVLAPGLTASVGVIVVLLFVAGVLLVYVSPQLAGVSLVGSAPARR